MDLQTLKAAAIHLCGTQATTTGRWAGWCEKYRLLSSLQAYGATRPSAAIACLLAAGLLDFETAGTTMFFAVNDDGAAFYKKHRHLLRFKE